MWLLAFLVLAGTCNAESAPRAPAERILLAQVNLGDVLPKMPRIPNLPGNAGNVNRGQPQAASPASAEKCKALVDWMSMLPHEYAQVSFQTTVVDALIQKAINLFRDEYFQPLLGKPFMQASEAELRSYDQRVFRSCGANQLSQQDLTTLRQLSVIVERPFILRAGSFSYQDVIAGVNERLTLIKWKDEALRDLTTLPATPEGFDRLEDYRTKGATVLAKLWPSEQRQFLNAVDERRKAQALGEAEKLAQSAGTVRAGVQRARDISAIRAGAGRYLGLLHDAGQTHVASPLDQGH